MCEVLVLGKFGVCVGVVRVEGTWVVGSCLSFT